MLQRDCKGHRRGEYYKPTATDAHVNVGRVRVDLCRVERQQFAVVVVQRHRRRVRIGPQRRALRRRFADRLHLAFHFAHD